MIDGVSPAQAAVRIRRWDIWLVRRAHRGRKGPVDAAKLLGVWKGDGLGIVVLRVVLLLGLRGVGVVAVVPSRRRGHWTLIQLRGAGAADEELVILAGSHAVAPGGLGISIACCSAVCLVPIVYAWRAAGVGVLILVLGAAARVWDVGVVVVLAVAVVRHGGARGWAALGRCDGVRGGRGRGRHSFTRLREEVARAA